tara:strand:+ start:498 stop:911 length:414 start_codon:yes stop_codon:yes gene_type:complete
MEDELVPQEEKDLLNKISSSRDKLEVYIKKVEELQTSVQTMFPKDIKDYRNKYLLEENVKTVTSFYALLLNLNQEVSKTVFSELEYRRKSKHKDGDVEIDIRALADKIDSALSDKKLKSIEQNIKKVETEVSKEVKK